jgi:short-subunit dehydrogenase
MHLKDKYLLLTGASGGIGQAIARELDKTDVHLLLAGRNREKLESLQQSLSGDHQLIIADINTSEGRDAIVEQCQQVKLKLFVNASGILDFQLYEQQDSQSIENMVTTNLLSPMLLCQRLIPTLKEHQEAAIINIGSIFGSIGHPGFTAYCASKFGLRGFTEALQRELADSPIKVSYLAPRATKTDLNSSAVTALNEALGNTTDSPEQVASEVMHILSDNQKQRYMGWPEKLFVRLNGLFPGIVHNALVKKLPLVRQHAQR